LIGEHLRAPLAILELEDPADEASFRIVYANDAAGSAWGAPVEALVGKGLLEALPALASTDLPRLYRDVLVERRATTVDGFHYAGGGAISAGTFCFEAFPLGDSQVGVVFERTGQTTRSAWHLRQLAAIVDSSSDAIISKTLNGTITSWNRAAEEMYGYTRDEAVGRSIELIVPLDRVEELRLILGKLRRGERVSEHETVRVKKDGSRFRVRVTVSPIHDLAGEVIGASAIGRDLTPEELTARELHRSREFFRTVFDEAGIAMWLCDTTGRLIQVNEATCALLGYTREELESRTVRDVLPASEHEAFDGRMRALIDGTLARFSAEKQYLRKDGEPVWVEVTGAPVRNAEGEVSYFIGQMQDIRPRREAEEQLRRSQDLYQLVVENSRDLISLIGLNGRYVFLSQAYEAALGLECGALEGTPALDLLHPDDRQTAQWWFEERAKAPALSKLRLRKADGTYLPVESHASFVYGDDGAPIALLSVSRDISQSVRNDELEARLRLAEKMEAIGQLAAGVAHDFNNLLTVIRGSAELARRRSDDAEVAAGLGAILHAAEDATQLTRQLLAFGGREVSRPEVLDLNAVIGEYEQMLDRLLGDDVEVSVERQPHLGLIRADRGQIGQIVVNLAVNARDAMPDGGTLSIVTSSVEDAPQPDGAPQSFVRLTVSDTGTGIADEVMQHLFEPFYTTKMQGKGTGLGLATVFGIVKQSGGRIDASSAPGRGSTFTIDLPVVDEAPSQPVLAAGSPAGRRSERVLVVDDNDLVRTITSTMLASHGYEVAEAAGGRSALVLAAAEAPFDLLVTDISMPGMNGVELAEALRRTWPGLRVVFTSGYGDSAFPAAGGVPEHEFLQKPFDCEALLHAAEAALRQP
jgi:two-component system cell cycle sensor histidine kinase/response regulator CckA